MRMTVKEALTIMQLYGQLVTKDLIKQAYRKLASKYHPDKNPDGLRYMQDINVAYEYLSNLPESNLSTGSPKKRRKSKKSTKPKEYDLFRSMGLLISEDHFSCKVWISGKTFPYKEHLKNYGFRWCPHKKAWWRSF